MAAIRVPYILACCVLALFAALLWYGPVARRARHTPVASTAVAPAVESASQVPATLGLWAGTPIPLEQGAIDLLGTDDVTVMEYRLGAGQEPAVFMAQVADYGNRAAFHPPELCFVGSHFEIIERDPILVFANGRDYPLMRLVVSQNGEQFESWYWFTANERVTHNYYQQQLWLVMDSIRREPASGSLVRISTTLDDPGAARRRLLAFLTSLTSEA